MTQIFTSFFVSKMNYSHTQKYPNNCKAKTKDILGIGNAKHILPSNYDLYL